MNRPYTIRICLWLALMLCTATVALGQESAYSLIEGHREWMRTHYPKAESLSPSQRLREAAFAIYDELKEPEALALLHAVGKDVPEVEAYADFKATGEKDYKFTHALSTLEALYHKAEQQLGRGDATTGWCKYLWLSVRDNMESIYPLLDAAIEEQEKWARKTGDKENAALVCLLKFKKFECSGGEYCGYSPDLYDEVLQAEREAIRLYPIADTTPSHTRAWLYMTMGTVKNLFSETYESDEAYGKVGLIAESFYGHNVNTGILHNAEHYFQLAEQAYLQLYTQGHPEVVEFYTAMEIARESYNTINDENIDVNKNLYDYAVQYYGQGHLATLLHKLSFWSIMASRGKEINDAFMWHSMEEAFCRYFGDDNVYYTNILETILQIVALYLPADFAEVSQVYDQCVARTFGTNSMKAAFYLYNPYGSLKDSYPDVFKEKALPQVDFYRQHHDKSLPSIFFGRRLRNDFYLSMSDLKRGTEIQQMVCEDVRQRYGNSSYTYLQEKAQALNWLASYDSDAARPQYPKLIEQLKRCGFDYTDVLGDYAALENGANNLQLAARLYQQAYDESAAEGDTPKRAYFLFSKLSLLPYLKAPLKEQETTYAEAKRILDTNQDTLKWIPTNYSLAADWLVNQKRYPEALAMLNRGIEICDWKDSGFSPEYMRLLTRRYELYAYHLDDMSTAYKLMEQDVDAFEKQNLSYYNVDRLDYLWGVYNLLPKSDDDWFTVSKYLNLIMKMTFSISQQNNQDIHFVATYGVRMLQEVVKIGIFANRFMKQVNLQALSEEQRQYMEKSYQTFNTLFDNLSAENILSELTSKIPHFEQQASYFALLNILENIFMYLRPDKEKALKYMNIHLEQSKKLGSSEIQNVCGTLFDFYMQEQEYEKAKKIYVENLKPLEEDKTLSEDSKLALYSRMCNLYWTMQDFEHLLPYARKFYSSMKGILNNNFQLFTEQEQNAFMNNYGDPASWFSTCLAGQNGRKDITPEVYNAVLYRTGMQLRSQAETRNAIMKSNDKALIALVDSLHLLRSLQKGVSYDITKDSQESLNKKYAEVANYQQRINMLERDIIGKSANYRSKTPLDATWTQVRGKLRQGEAAIEFIYAYPYWMALVVTPGSESPTAIKLVAVDSLNAKMTALNANTPTVMARRLYDNEGINLYAMLWQPLEDELKGIRKVYYTTQGMLSSLSFPAIRTPDKKYLVDHYDLCPLTTTAQLLVDENEQQPKSILVMGDIYYSDKQKEQVVHGDISTARGDDDLSIDDFSDRGAKRYHFKYLPFTKTEMKDVEEVFHDKKVFTGQGTEATEQCLRTRLQDKPDIVHLATHGFFIASDMIALRVPFFKRYAQAASNSMQRAGVALAGAEDTWNGTKTPEEDNDGILTANEVAQMNLGGTQLVALSACETALGNYTFEGVFGLPRGFKQAGVKSLLVSLWSVNDKSTALLMTAFYRYWMQGATKHEAFNHAVSDVRKDYLEPYYWAPFLLLDALK